ncbi:MAG: L-serine ammonia-lyase, iron-sulfur-dependent, subunit alpha [Candidatus Kariarchaeaceae archaeon]
MKISAYPSIFNDVIGPVMRGPSSSHCAASVRIGRMARDLMGEDLQEVLIEFDPAGSLATTHQTQGSDMGLFGGLLGWEADDERLIGYAKAIKEAGVKVNIEINELHVKHENTYKLTLRNSKESYEMVAISTGGGMIEIVEINGVKVSMMGDYYETLVFTNEEHAGEIRTYLNEKFIADEVFIRTTESTTIIEVKSQAFMDQKILHDLHKQFTITAIKELNPVLPILSRKGIEIPFKTCEEMLIYNENKKLDLWELAVEYEKIRGNISAQEVFNKMRDICRIMQKSILKGIEGTDYQDRILGYQSGEFKEKMDNQGLLKTGILNQIILNITAMMEVKSSMGVIVAAPTAGACATLPGALIGATNMMDMNEDELTKAMLAASIIGIFIAIHSTFSAELGGCQSETGSAAGMAAAGLVYLGKGSLQQAINAVSMTLQNTFGLICDPVGNRVEVPCLGKNVMGASNALSSANMALANFDSVIPLDEVIKAMDEVAKTIPRELRCTALGGLSITNTSKMIEHKLKEFHVILPME